MRGSVQRDKALRSNWPSWPVTSARRPPPRQPRTGRAWNIPFRGVMQKTPGYDRSPCPPAPFASSSSRAEPSRASARLARSTHASSPFRLSTRSSVSSAWSVRPVLSAFTRSTRSRSSSSPAFVKAAQADSRSASTRDRSASSRAISWSFSARSCSCSARSRRPRLSWRQLGLPLLWERDSHFDMVNPV